MVTDGLDKILFFKSVTRKCFSIRTTGILMKAFIVNENDLTSKKRQKFEQFKKSYWVQL